MGWEGADSGTGELQVEAAKHAHHGATRGEGELDAPGGVDQPCGQVHQLLHHGADAPTRDAMTPRSIGANQPLLSDPAQDVVGEPGAGENERVGGELARGPTLDIEIALERAVELLRGPMLGVQGDDRLRIVLQSRPPAFDLDLGDRQVLSALVDAALGDPDDPSQGES